MKGWIDCITSNKDLLQTIGIIFSPILLFLITYRLKRSADVQYAATLMTAFQDEWHSRMAVLMRDALQTECFAKAFDEAIEKAYGQQITDNKISRLLDHKELKGNCCVQDRLEIFHRRLMHIVFRDPISNENILFSGYEALYRVLLSFDRLAVLCDEPQAMKKFIQKYRPPLRDFSCILQSFIAVRVLLRKEEDKNYKKHYMQLLRMLGLADSTLYKICRIGIMKRGEWTLIDSLRVNTRRAYRWCVKSINRPIW